MKLKTALTLAALLSVPAVHAGADINVCDLSALGKDNAVRTLHDRNARAWVAFSGADATALCLYTSKYLLFPEPLKTLARVTATDTELTAEFSSAGAVTAYHIPLAGLNARIQPYRGETAGLLFSYLTVARPGAGPSLVGVQPDSGFSANFKTALGDYAKTNWLWNSEKVRKNVAAAVETMRKKTPGPELQACAPKAEIRLAFSRAYLSKYIDAVARKDKTVLAAFSRPAVTFVCTGPNHGSQPPRTVLTLAALLDSFK
ncbi:MAG: hypothetical protein PHW69_06700 [Elusimicrobiaceae bacterium]|nr:hypothetical protein [Elusimicrobiaceae bacterium]